jgi:protein-S-isoprenylcysteine O-methyltransferase Ste14
MTGVGICVAFLVATLGVCASLFPRLWGWRVISSTDVLVGILVAIVIALLTVAAIAVWRERRR